MPKTNDPVLRMAGLIHRRLRSPDHDADSQLATALDELTTAHAALATAWRRRETARRRGWHGAARVLREGVTRLTASLAGHVSVLHAREAEGLAAPAGPADLRTAVDELRQLADEFGEDAVELRFAKGGDVRVVATTDPITLEGVRLGPFAVELHVGRLGPRADAGCFDVVATEPNPASSNDGVTHPHVSDQSLCAGEAAWAIGQALRQGRVCDALVLVRSVLQTYNPASPYVSLDDWAGESCGDCGRSCGSDDLYACGACGSRVCDRCSTSCEVCDESCCRGCLERDRVAGTACCPDCRTACADCGRVVADGEGVSDSGLCPECHAKQEEEDDDEDEGEEEHDQEDEPTEIVSTALPTTSTEEHADERDPDPPPVAVTDGDATGPTAEGPRTPPEPAAA